MNGFSHILSPLQREVLRWLRRMPGLSRAGLSRQLLARPNSVGDAVAGLLELRLLREGVADTAKAGRPQVPLRLDDSLQGRTILGIAVRPNRLLGRGLRDASFGAASVEVRAVGLLGRTSGPVWRGTGAEAHAAIAEWIDDRTLGVSVAMPGLIDADHPFLQKFESADVPRIVNNDVHALAARWLLAQPVAKAEEDTLLIQLGDGQIGASLLIDGRPNRGVIRGGNELGHTRLPVATEPCFCGHTGCLERIASTPFLHRHGASRVRTLTELLSSYPAGVASDDRAVEAMIDPLALGVANALQLLRPDRLVVVSEFTRFTGFCEVWWDRIRRQLFPELAERIVFESWDQPLSTPAESAAHLGLAALFDARW